MMKSKPFEKLGGDKPPGLDGFSILFYQFFLEAIKAELIRLMESFHQGALQTCRINNAQLDLSPKIALGISHPISILNSSLQIFYINVLANKLISVLGTLDRDYQSRFIAQAKFYESLWPCWLEMSLGVTQEEGFWNSRSFSDWGLFKLAKLSILVNGEEGKQILCKHRIKQGYPLSPWDGFD